LRAKDIGQDDRINRVKVKRKKEERKAKSIGISNIEQGTPNIEV
jgi:hypothetical protein